MNLCFHEQASSLEAKKCRAIDDPDYSETTIERQSTAALCGTHNAATTCCASKHEKINSLERSAGHIRLACLHPRYCRMDHRFRSITSLLEKVMRVPTCKTRIEFPRTLASRLWIPVGLWIYSSHLRRSIEASRILDTFESRLCSLAHWNPKSWRIAMKRSNTTTWISGK